MARLTIGVIFHADDKEADEILRSIRQHNIDLIHVQQSYGKLWIRKGDAP